ncbi:MAG: hypothetical protein P1V20_15580 [Verrucomicrobiales bacterium]|nr:hypothetical protein [Verrucomicrobiales bacterium]
MDYSDSTPDVSFTYRRAGNVHTVTHDGSTYSYDYGLPGELEKTTITGGILDGAVIDPAYDALHRRNALTVNPGNGAATVTQSQTYEAGTSRLDTVSQGGYSSTYSYHTNSSLINTLTHRDNGADRLTETRVYDNLNRLYSIATSHKSFTYSYNDANQRTRVDREDNTYWSYGYDALGHVTSAVKKLADNSSLAGHQFGYAFDALGNRTSATFGGDATGAAGFQTVSYTANAAGDRNQYSEITNPGVVLTTGKAAAAASVTVNTQSAQDRQGDYFAHQTAVANEITAQHIDLTIVADDGTDTDTTTRSELVPVRDATRSHDADGNLTFDGYRDYTWDAENRLLAVQTRANLVPTGANETKVEYEYDYLSRRIRSVSSRKIGNEWNVVKESRYLYDGWNVIAEINGNKTAPVLMQSYLWGINLSGTAQGAGGVGGLLAIQKHTGDTIGVHFVAYDGNGNVVALADAADGSLSASYEYDAFGNLLNKSGVFAAANPYRFSTKPQDEVTGLYYYGYRYYDPENGRWLNRDPIEEDGGVNLYGFVGNDGILHIDRLGLDKRESNHNPNGEGRGTVWHFTSHEIQVNCECECKESANDVYWKLKDFTEFNRSGNINASVDIGSFWDKKEKEYQTVGKFDVKGFPGIMSDLSTIVPGGNSTTIDVELTFDKHHKNIMAETLGRHVLIGIRMWEVKCFNKQVTIRTHAWEKFRSWVGVVGSKPARAEMNNMWATYMNEVADSLVKDKGCKKFGAVKFEEVSKQSSFNPYFQWTSGRETTP